MFHGSMLLSEALDCRDIGHCFDPVRHNVLVSRQDQMAIRQSRRREDYRRRFQCAICGPGQRPRPVWSLPSTQCSCWPEHFLVSLAAWVCLLICVSVSFYFHVCICLSVCIPVSLCFSVCPSMHVSVFLSVSLSVSFVEQTS